MSKTILRLELACHECERGECYLTMVFEVEEGKAYKPPSDRCVCKESVKANWKVERIEIEEAEEAE